MGIRLWHRGLDTFELVLRVSCHIA